MPRMNASLEREEPVPVPVAPRLTGGVADPVVWRARAGSVRRSKGDYWNIGVVVSAESVVFVLVAGQVSSQDNGNKMTLMGVEGLRVNKILRSPIWICWNSDQWITVAGSLIGKACNVILSHCHDGCRSL
jgi:hypothetical protein